MTSLQKLIHSLQYNKAFIPLFKSYNGEDWKPLIRYNENHPLSPKSLVLFRSTTSKLVLTGWHPYQYYEYIQKNATIHTLLLEGNLYSRIKKPELPVEKNILAPFSYTHILPYTHWNVLCIRKTASLHLIQLTE